MKRRHQAILCWLHFWNVCYGAMILLWQLQCNNIFMQFEYDSCTILATTIVCCAVDALCSGCWYANRTGNKKLCRFYGIFRTKAYQNHSRASYIVLCCFCRPICIWDELFGWFVPIFYPHGINKYDDRFNAVCVCVYIFFCPPPPFSLSLSPFQFKLAAVCTRDANGRKQMHNRMHC